MASVEENMHGGFNRKQAHEGAHVLGRKRPQRLRISRVTLQAQKALRQS